MLHHASAPPRSWRTSGVPAPRNRSEVAAIEQVQRAGQSAGGFEEDSPRQLIAQRNGIRRLEHADAIAQCQPFRQTPGSVNAGANAGAFGVQLEVLYAQARR